MRTLSVIGSIVLVACTSNPPPRDVEPRPQTASAAPQAAAPEKPLTPELPQSATSRHEEEGERSDGTVSSQLSTMRDPVPPSKRVAAPPSIPGPEASAEPPGTRPLSLGTPASSPSASAPTSDLDLMLVQRIQRAVRESSLSSIVKKVQITAQGGKVTLRGSVKSEQERKFLDDSARKVAGVGNVDDQVEVTE